MGDMAGGWNGIMELDLAINIDRRPFRLLEGCVTPGATGPERTATPLARGRTDRRGEERHDNSRSSRRTF